MAAAEEEDTDSMPHPPSLKELKALRPPVRDVNEGHSQHLKPLERIAIWITDHVGSMGFFLVILTWTLLWLGWNALGPKQARFDPFPAFVLWLFISNMIQICLMPLIMIGQNLQSRHSEARAESDYEVNVKAEREIEAILMHLEAQATKIEKILEGMARDGSR
jgi:uncharacterized membrane protein